MNKPLSVAEATAHVDAVFDEAIAGATSEEQRQFYRLQRLLNSAYVEWGIEARHALNNSAREILPIACEALAAVANMVLEGVPEPRREYHRLVFAQMFVEYLRNQRSIGQPVPIRDHDA